MLFDNFVKLEIYNQYVVREEGSVSFYVVNGIKYLK